MNKFSKQRFGHVVQMAENNQTKKQKKYVFEKLARNNKNMFKIYTLFLD